MLKKIIISLAIVVIYSVINISTALAIDPPECTPGDDTICKTYDPDFTCQSSGVYPGKFFCQEDKFGPIFGKIKPPDALKGFIAKDPTGAGGISIFLSNLVALIYVLAAIVLIFMILWGAFDWMTSEGDKEKIARARDKIINAIVGILLFAAAFAIIKVIGQFTGFTFFVGQ